MGRLSGWSRVVGLLVVEMALFAVFWFSMPVMG